MGWERRGGGGGGADRISHLLVSLKCIEHLNDVWMVELLHDLYLFPQTVQLLLTPTKLGDELQSNNLDVGDQ